MKKSDETKYHVQALTKGLLVLEAFKDTDEYGVTDLGQLINLPESSIQRIINTLEFSGYLYQNPENKKYRLSPKILQTHAKSMNFQLWRDNAKKHMQALSDTCGENVNLAVRDHDKCSYIELVESKHLLRPNFTLFDSYPLYCTSLGRSLLCDVSDEIIAGILPDTIQALTPYTVVNKMDLLKIIRAIKEAKYAVEVEEFYLGLCCVGGPVFGVGNKVVAALSVTAPKVRLTSEKIEELIPLIVATTEKLSEDFKKLCG